MSVDISVNFMLGISNFENDKFLKVDINVVWYT